MKNIEITKLSEKSIWIKGEKLNLRWTGTNGDRLLIWSEKT
jgi:hypothetical protein